jgi:iron complex transport system ATP-binding protein
MGLVARALSLTIDGRSILDDITMMAGAGEVLGLIGPNGAGKTSLLRLLAGLAAPDRGEIVCDDRPLAAYPARERAQRIAYLAQGGPAHWPLSVEALVALGRLPHRGGGMSDGDDAAVARAMDAADIGHLRGRTIGTLSGGERARVMLARALAVEAPTLLVDEPVASLDPLHQLRIMNVLVRTARDGAAVIVVLHDLTLAARFCHRLLLLDGGRVRAAGEPVSVLTEENLAGTYGVSVLSGQHLGERFIVPWRVRENEGGES